MYYANYFETDKLDYCAELNLYDRVHFPEYKNCNFKYLNYEKNRFIPSEIPNKQAEVILERSVSNKYWWVVIKLGNKMRENIQ